MDRFIQCTVQKGCDFLCEKQVHCYDLKNRCIVQPFKKPAAFSTHHYVIAAAMLF